MTNHKSEDYKISAVKYYLKGEKTQEEICKIYECSVRSLMRWVDRYKVEKEIKRHNRKNISYKITKKQVQYIIDEVKKNKTITMNDLLYNLKLKYKKIDIIQRHLSRIITEKSYYDNIKVINGTILSLSSEQLFDTIIYIDVLEHIKDDKNN